MTYGEVAEAVFLCRPNRFVAHCRLGDGTEVIAHVPNTGRCRELLVPGVRVWLTDHLGAPRKTRYSLVAVDKGGLLINIDSQAPNRVVEEALRSGALCLTDEPPTLVRREYVYGDSRLDFYLEAPGQRVLAEVKGVTLERDGVAAFPDAPTLRGLRHVRELTAAAARGYGAAVVFLLQMEGMNVFSPNDEAQPEFRPALAQARQAGVAVQAWESHVTPDGITLAGRIPVDI